VVGAYKSANAVSWCPEHQKLLYTDRKRARRVARQHSEHKNAFRCDVYQGMWHIGGLPDAIRHGHMTKAEYYAKRRRKSA
jgi:hypothetical protein